MKKLRIGIIGIGIGEQHLNTYMKLPACDVTLLCDKDRHKLKLFQTRYPSIAQTTQEKDVLENPNIDLVSIASYDHMHAKQVISALQSKKHVFVEKPLCQTSKELSLIHKEWKKNHGRLKLMANLVLRKAPVYIWLKEQIRRGRMGTLYAIDGEYLYGRLEKLINGWRKKVPDYSVLRGGGIHMLDLILWLTGQQPHTVEAQGNRLCTQKSVFRYPDFVTATLLFPSTLIGRLTGNFGCVHPHQHVLRVFGTKATFLMDDQGPRWITSRLPEHRPKKIALASLPLTKGELIPDFIETICHPHLKKNDMKTLFDTMGILNACEQSLKTGHQKRIVYL